MCAELYADEGNRSYLCQRTSFYNTSVPLFFVLCPTILCQMTFLKNEFMPNGIMPFVVEPFILSNFVGRNQIPEEFPKKIFKNFQKKLLENLLELMKKNSRKILSRNFQTPWRHFQINLENSQQNTWWNFQKKFWRNC